MKRDNLRKVEIHEVVKIMSLPGPGQHQIGEDNVYYDGYFHGWDNNGKLKGIIELDEGNIVLIPYECIKFLD